jgi:hypothetical protein
MLFVESFKNKFTLPDDVIVIDTTSRSDNWTKGFSPFIIYGGHLYGNYYAKNVENAWQFSKVYEQFDNNGIPKPEYFEWSQKGWIDKYAHRYPMGKGIKPLYSWWDGIKLDYVEARKKIYVPIYSRGVIKTETFNKLLDIYRTTNKDIYLIDFDGYNHIKMGKSLIDVLNDPNMKMGHGFVIFNLLTKMK